MSKDSKRFWSQKALAAPSTPFKEPVVPVTYNFDQGVPAPEAYPLEELKKYAALAIDRFGAANCDYFSAGGWGEMVYGYVGLRREIAARVARLQQRDFGVDGVMLVNGSVHGLSLAAAALVGPGDGVIVEALSFPYAVSYFAAAGATISTVPVDEHGLDVDVVAMRLKELKAAGVKPKLIYAIPTFQVPTGTCLSLERRMRLLELANEWDLVVIEDNAYGELRYEGVDLPSLLTLDREARVLQSGSFSKILAPGLRTGWMVGSRPLLAALGAVRQDLGVSQWFGHMLELYLQDGKLDPHLDRLRTLNRRKRDLAVEALRTHCGANVSFRVPEGGIFLWLELPAELDGEQVGTYMAAHGVACRPGERFTSSPDASQFLRLSFLQVPFEEIERGVAVLGEALRHAGAN